MQQSPEFWFNYSASNNAYFAQDIRNYFDTGDFDIEGWEYTKERDSILKYFMENGGAFDDWEIEYNELVAEWKDYWLGEDEEPDTPNVPPEPDCPPIHPIAKIVSEFKNSLISRYDPEEYNIEICKNMSMLSLMRDYNLWKHHIAHYKQNHNANYKDIILVVW